MRSRANSRAHSFLAPLLAPFPLFPLSPRSLSSLSAPGNYISVASLKRQCRYPSPPYTLGPVPYLISLFPLLSTINHPLVGENLS